MPILVLDFFEKSKELLKVLIYISQNVKVNNYKITIS